MAKVIHTPNIKAHRRRALPLDSDSVETVDQAGKPHQEITKQSSPSTAQVPTQEYVNRLESERNELIRKNQELENKLNTMEQEFDRIVATQTDKGYQAGLDRAEEELHRLRSEHAQQVQSAIDGLVGQQGDLIRQAEESAVEIGMAATFKILGRTKNDNDLLKALVRQSMHQLLSRQGLTIYLRPDDVERMESIAKLGDHQWTGVEFKPDNGIELGGCRIESKAGSLDARLEVQIAELKRVLLQAGNKRHRI